MSKISEYLSLLPSGLKNIDKFIEGVINDVSLEFSLLSEENKDIIVKRRLICSSCPYMSKNANNFPDYKELHKEDYKTDREDNHCTFCGCPLAFRTASLDMQCGIKEWNEEQPNKQLPIKW